MNYDLKCRIISVETVELLIANGADVNAKLVVEGGEDKGVTALLTAALKGVI